MYGILCDVFPGLRPNGMAIPFPRRVPSVSTAQDMNENTVTLKDAIDLALRHHNAGDLETARNIYQKILQQEPDQPVALHFLGVLAHQVDRNDVAVDLIGRAVANRPDYAEAHGNLGLALHALGRLDEAVASYEAALAIKPDFAECLYNLGNALHERGNQDEAVASYEKALSLNPDFAEAYDNLGNALRDQGKLDEAVASHRKAIAIDPDYAEAHNNLGNALQAQGKPDEAVASYRRAIALKSDYAEAHNNLGNTLRDLGRLDEAVAGYRRAVEIRPDFAETHNNLGLALKAQGKLDDAVASYRKALTAAPDLAVAHNNLGTALLEQGKTDEAVACYDRAIGIEPDYAEAYQNLSRAMTFAGGEAQIAKMLELHGQENLSDHDRALVGFALGKAFEDIGDYERSFGFIREANRFRKRELGYSFRQDELLFSGIREKFDSGASLPAISLPPVERGAVVPVFILGMPRSGTTLVEQIVSSHADVYGAGELECLAAGVARFSLMSEPLSEDSIRALRDFYLAEVGTLNATERIITDKMPHNFRWIGFILAAFPEAKIIHVKRDKMATCWSVYKHYFATTGNGFAYDLSDLAGYYSLYEGLMDFWHATFPGKIYDLSYERLTENQEEETKNLISHLGLPWQDSCLAFHENRRAVRTASLTQVRQKMYQGSSKDWERYKPYLGEFIDQFQDRV